MFLRDNYVHGDMHAGNLIFSTEQGRVTVIDAGLITSLKPDVANQFGEFLRGLCQSDADLIVDRLLYFNVGKAEVDKVRGNRKIHIDSQTSKLAKPDAHVQVPF
jgi:predicted unusual protein kinase regulating ubiquinone biosynthesis (AarF/ABC1/UbiB family)